MKGFNFEKNLNHQTNAVNSTVAVFENLDIKKADSVDEKFINPELDLYSSYYAKNIYH